MIGIIKLFTFSKRLCFLPHAVHNVAYVSNFISQLSIPLEMYPSLFTHLIAHWLVPSFGCYK